MKSLRLFITVMCLLPLPVYAKQTTPYFCFKESQNNNLLLISEEEFPKVKTVQYYPYMKKISLKFTQYDAVDTAQGRPSEFHDFYKEIINQKETGTYEIVYQGAVLYNVNYTSKKTKKMTQFDRLYPDDGQIFQKLKQNGVKCF
ncbi:MAG: hypothetical protein I4N51_08010 [Acinetobacter sp.]|nr:hypothetical protein [Acinetobacter sp.]